MRMLLFSLAFLVSNSIHSQTLKPSVSLDLKTSNITGIVIDSKTGKPLEYASVGIINTQFGGVTDTNGNFSFEVKGLSENAIIRFSMIGYAPQVYKVNEYLSNDGKIQLVESPIIIPEVIIKPSNKTRKLGTTSFNHSGDFCGWGGSQFGRGYEDGTIINLGEKPVLISSLHVRIMRQAFDTCYFRLHIRSFKNDMVGDELLPSNIIIYLTKESGWETVDLSKYSLVYSGTVALSIEWLKVKGVNEKRAMVINKKLKKEFILFKIKKNNLGLFRSGVEANWTVKSEVSPAMYLTVKE